jgi:hypothetical protein
MRHLWTLIAAIVIAPAAWLLIAFGQTQSGAAFAKATQSGTWTASDFVWPLLFLAGAGILLGLIGTLRFSPLGAVLTGLLYVASFVAVLVDGKDVYKLFNYKISILKHDALLPVPVANGTTLVLGSLLLVAVASVARWRRATAAVPAEAAPGDEFSSSEQPTEDTKDFWTPTTPVTTPLVPPSFGDEPSTERVVPGGFGSPWRTPPGENSTEDQPR